MTALTRGFLPALAPHSSFLTALPFPDVRLAEVSSAARIEPRGHLRIQVADALLGLVAHPLAVVAHVLGQALRAMIGARKEE